MGLTILMWYLIFALATALTAMYELFVPILRDLEVLVPEDNLVHNKYLTYLTFFVMALLTAPILFPVVIIPQMSDWFKKTMLDTLTGVPVKI